ncbi:unnamed protein product [Phytophthora fragariaefolia]|uniref:Unnamed protein product n=1 Tax=Phytophthora fragariaefolia TaxID=1490495 RepID=A0A9W6XUM8_9STRA|nr:unnamed protein product [Phytophthora fragariaefolia]
MNGYLRSKCSSEQQLLNELAKLLGAKDVASRKMADVLRALTYFYTSAARGSRIPQSLLSGLCSLLPQLKDKKEVAILKDEHQRIARIALCLLARLVDQFEIQRELAARLTDSQKLHQEQSVDPGEQVLANFLVTLETAVMTPTGLLLPRQRATLRVYAQLCRVFRKREQLVGLATTVLQQSPVLAENAVDAKGKKVTPPGPAQIGAVAGACHALRFHTAPNEQAIAVDKMVQLAFTIPAGTASRHAAKMLLSLLTSSTLNEGRPSNALVTAKATELYLLKAHPRTLLGGDSLTSVYLLRLCGQMYRLPVHQQQQQHSTPNDTGLEHASALTDGSLGTSQQKPTDQNPALQGFLMSKALSAQIQEYLVDVIHTGGTESLSIKSSVAPAVLLVAIEEVLRGTSPEASLCKQPNWGSVCIFELVAAALLSLLSAPGKPVNNTVTLHRVCRAVQFVAERLDTIVLQLGVSSGQAMETPAYLSSLTLRIRKLTEHSNVFVACEALRAFVWLLPRNSTSADENGTNKDDWTSLFWQLETLPFNRIQPERRAAIAWTLFRRCVSTPKAYGYEVWEPLLAGCLRIVLAWFRIRPCVWQAALMIAIWQTALRECLTTLGDAVFLSVNEVLDIHCPHTDSAAPDSLVVKQSALHFLSHREGGMKYAARNEAWSSPLILRLTKQALLETCTSQRISSRALLQLRDEAQLQGHTPLTQQVQSTLDFLQKIPRQSIQGSDDSKKQAFSLHDELFTDKGVVTLTDEDPFTDFRAPDDADSTRPIKAFDDPFADAVRTNSATAFDFAQRNAADAISNAETFSDFNTLANDSAEANTWRDAGAPDNQCKMATTAPAMFSTRNTSSFSNWSDNVPPKDQAEFSSAEDNFFGNFSQSDSSQPVFSSWGDGDASQVSQPKSADDDNSFGNFSATSDTREFTNWSTTSHISTPTSVNEPTDQTSDSTARTGFDDWGSSSTFQPGIQDLNKTNNPQEPSGIVRWR